MNLRAAFLIVAACLALRLPIWAIFAILTGYEICGYVDRKIADKAKNKVIDYQLFDWKPYDKDPAYEEKEEWTRIRLDGSNQIIVTRVAELLRGI